ncbi:1-(5-phosphoribosyl)-5-[(5-phosphoribosylamino)methylideneamino]imidazole-4-carboxamide isomerase [Alkalibacter rhizosphaerae]|uniref:1-(5-phosphoribosyl)-5-[(5-phosphoribosylamino)methylideneamino] imidazole-4-carboxamide isomerase n=1 Tax=Alkalibacter rhizosphaerae TaxID=2815577 RepID=A0A974XF66_9FIRM|nr:1-(5-phosphoribosyl)-5-[(5-phosphoribosylamino)methylideneamino]imidazole-4-carboxamide isomerase [Alkalibacter rhizosphaerae]QSX07605.1 1-(5-phosphoribosyl)-5-[(5-phosphoribosylamino)methylideneamino]imidazole-4-carboxamide isomerase [Alkalibacter rhizosphaerae]
MIVLPAIDIKNGRCVRLQQGLMDQETAYFDDPVQVAKMWETQGASYLHLVDLDGAFTGNQPNKDLIRRMVASVSIPVELGGGIRSEETVDSYLSMGVDRVILGTRAVEDMDLVKRLCDKYPGRIAVSVDAKGDFVAVKGWVETSDKKVLPFCRELQEAGVATIIYTDISRDGMLMGPNVEMLKTLQEKLDVDIIASGGIARIDNIKELAGLDLYGAITGKALYEGTLTMKEILDFLGEDR